MFLCLETKGLENCFRGYFAVGGAGEQQPGMVISRIKDRTVGSVVQRDGGEIRLPSRLSNWHYLMLTRCQTLISELLPHRGDQLVRLHLDLNDDCASVSRIPQHRVSDGA
jgi:hypothetical protein